MGVDRSDELFGIGTMFAHFQKVGKEHCCIDILKSFVREGVIALAVSLSIRAGILSGPVALGVSIVA